MNTKFQMAATPEVNPENGVRESAWAAVITFQEFLVGALNTYSFY